MTLIQKRIVLAHVLFLTQVWIFGLTFAIVSIIVGWMILNLVISLYIHRIRCHNNFQVHPIIHKVGSFIFSGLNLGSPELYVAVHIKHHRESGTEEDPHDPYNRGFWKLFSSAFDEKFSPDRKTLRREFAEHGRFFYDHHKQITTTFTWIVPVLPMLAFWHSKFVLIVAHIKSLGYRTYDLTNDTSRNIWWLKPLLWGEELHNNHHAKWVQPNHNHLKSWKEFDLLYYIGRMISKK